jgi:site-specific DNA recombinase
MKSVVAYCRVSTNAQAGDDKFGIDAQKEQIMEYCQKNDMQISEWFVDEGVSGVKEERPEFDKILYGEMKNPPVEAVVVAKNDRIARDIKLYFYFSQVLYRKGIQLISVSEDFGEMGAFKGILEAFVMFAAEQERANIMKRTTYGRGIKSSRGGYSGGKAPFGYYVKDKSLIINETEAKIVRLIFEQRKSGATLKSICDLLNSSGYKTRKGGQFYISNVQSILGNENTYRGMYRYGKKGEWVQGQQEPILPD